MCDPSCLGIRKKVIRKYISIVELLFFSNALLKMQIILLIT
ncbi:hypothetical protein CLTEP_20910 [Clostridium tepidiprofundi DSM 19306]|uniref:Uncharacterized protein n=1 Tax=Clostridium tepidiprofundi DSM 19306 TaxID=1121338 RepID=A0A151B2H6_9CLOT|nr:hypothetical protein CLTEP_20910 [Clostridium tepidiprofundi DSM 19306]